MKPVHMSESSLESVVEMRRKSGAGRLDECWEGVWHLTDPTARHQEIAGRIYRIHAQVVEDERLGSVWISINVTDRERTWMENHRCPDGAVILRGNPGRWVEESRAAFLGGPDLVVEVRSPDDETLDKLPFYASLGVREVLMIDQRDSAPQLWRLEGGRYREVSGVSEVTGLEYLAAAAALEVRHPPTGRLWKV